VIRGARVRVWGRYFSSREAEQAATTLRRFGFDAHVVGADDAEQEKL
jgi:hypothetical protein